MTAARPPAQPSYIFRGHAAAIHSVQIVCRNTRLVTGDAEGWIVVWKLESKRPVAVWRAHDAAILGTGEWMDDRIITHGRDHALRIWQLHAADEEHMSKVLPADDPATSRPKPWLLHTLPANTLNFCAFSMCVEPPTLGYRANQAAESTDPILVAVPARDDKKIEVYRVPDERLLHVVPKIELKDTGMVMAVKLAYEQSSNNMLVLVGYEGGFTAVHVLSPPFPGSATSSPSIQLAQAVYLSQPHTQPVLSVDASPDAKVYYTSSADAIIAAHRIPDLPSNSGSTESSLPENSQIINEVAAIETQSNAQTAGPMDSGPPVRSQTEPSGSSDNPASESLTFAKQPVPPPKPGSTGSPSLSFSKKPFPNATSSFSWATASRQSGLSSLLSTSPAQANTVSAAAPTPPLTIQDPYKSINTRHSGQQSLQVRSDGRIFVTGGWDSKMRIYSAKTLKEVAVLKWHKEGVYAAAFGSIIESAGAEMKAETGSEEGTEGTREMTVKEPGALTGLSKLQKQREAQIQLKHWVVAGAKDGKVSLWEVF